MRAYSFGNLPIFSLIQVEVTAVLESYNSIDWIVSYKRFVPGSFDLEEQRVRATYVILGAGAIGSTKILLRSKERGLEVSDEIGKRFSTNGDVFGFSYNGDKTANSVGIETKNMTSAHPPGPCITSVMDFRKVNGGSFQDNFVIEDGTPPSVVSLPFSVGVSFSAKIIGIDKYPATDLLEKTFQVRTLTSHMSFDFNTSFFFLPSIIIMLKS